MKPNRFSIKLALVILLLAGCSSVEPEGGNSIVRPDSSLDIYRINFSFKDPQGNDLLKQFAYYKSDPTNPKYLGEVDPELYTLRIVSSNHYPLDTFYFNMAKFDELHSWVRTDKNGVYANRGTWYFSNDYVIKSKYDGTPYSPLEYHIKSGAIYNGSLRFHTVYTWWEEGTKDKESGQHFPECVRASVDGIEIKPIKGITYNNRAEPYYVGYFIDIVVY